MVTYRIRRAYASFATHVLDVPPRLLGLLFFMLLLAYPATGPKSYYVLVLTLASIFAVFGMSWDFLAGRAGQVSLGHSLFFGIGGYVTGLLYRFYLIPVWVSVPIAVLVAVVAALLVGFPALRVKGSYLALVSMTFPLIVTGVVFYYGDITGGENGLYALPRFFPSLNIRQIYLADYYFTLILLFISAVVLYKIASSKTGIVLVSILDDELASKASGINVTKYKLLAFAISAIFASLSGAVYAHVITAISPLEVFSVSLSFTVIIQTMLGGIGSIYGPMVAAYIIYILDQVVLVSPPVGVVYVPGAWHFLIFIAIVIVIVIKLPRGLGRWVVNKLEDLSEEREIEERGKRIWKKYKRKG